MSRRSSSPVRTLAVAAALGAAALVPAAYAAPFALTVHALEPAAPQAANALTPLAAPAAPTDLTGQSVQSDSAVLLWRDRSGNETGFAVEARLAGDATFASIGSVGANVSSVSIVGLAPGETYVFRVRATNASGTSGPSNDASVTALADDDCVESATAMCLDNSEFRVQALYLTNGGLSGEAHAVKLVADSGYLWFFGAANIEAVVKVLDGCTANSHFWVFAGGLTDVRVVLTVTDTVAGISKSYNNPQGRPFQPIQDTAAFGTCP